jgi:hypothetical protein
MNVLAFEVGSVVRTSKGWKIIVQNASQLRYQCTNIEKGRLPFGQAHT